MKLSSFHFIRLGSPEGWSEQDVFDYELQCVEFAEEFGLDGVWLAEHHFRSDVCPSTLSLAAFVAGRTKRIRIGLGVLVLPFYDPIRLAEDVAVVDLLSRGRLNVGIGRGYNPMEFDAFSVPIEESRSRHAETLEVLLQAWTNGVVCHQGEIYNIENVPVIPRPLQKPHPPLWVAAASEETVELCGAAGIPFMSDPIQSFEQSAALVHLWSASAKASGHDPAPAELAALRGVWVADTMSQALADLPVWAPRSLEDASGSPAQAPSWDPLDPTLLSAQREQQPDDASPGLKMNPPEVSLALQEKVRNDHRFIVGDPDTVVKKLRAYHDAGYSHIIGVFNSATRLPLEKVRGCMELFSREVLPHVKAL